MKANCYRMKYNKTKEGVYYTASMRDFKTEESLHVAYISGGAVPVDNDDYDLDLLVLGDTCQRTVNLAMQWMKDRVINRVIIPGGYENIGDFQKICDSCQVVEVNDRYEVKKNRWEIRFISIAGESGRTISMYQGFTDDNKDEEDCVLVCKTFCRENCIPYIHSLEDLCGMGCIRHKDVDVLKGHKSRDSEDYCIGGLILGDISLKEHEEKVKEFISDVKNKIRHIGLPKPLTTEDIPALKGLLRGDEDYEYIVGSKAQTNLEAVSNIIVELPYVRYAMSSEETGFCLSGYRTLFLRKDC